MEAIGMSWQGHFERQWETCYAEAERYYLAHGNLQVATDYIQNGIAL